MKLLMKLAQIINNYQKSTLAGIYPSSFTNIRFWIKIAFPNVIFREKRSQNQPTKTLTFLSLEGK